MTIATESANVTEASQPSTPATFADDAVVRAWERGAATVSREALLDRAQRKLSRLTALNRRWDGYDGSPVAPLAAMVLNGILRLLVQDDGPTPQIAPIDNGGVEVEWLVGGDSMTIYVLSDGVAVFDAERADGVELLSGQMLPGRPDQFLLDQAAVLLEKLSHGVHTRATGS